MPSVTRGPGRAKYAFASTAYTAAPATGGFRFRTNLTGTTGCNLPAGSGVFNCTSSRYTKENFTTIKGGDILSKLRLIPVTSWNYIDEGARVRHISTGCPRD